MGTYDPLIEASTLFVLRKHDNPNPSTMKCVFVLLALVAMTSAEGIYSDSKFFTGDLDNIQGANADIAKAAESLQTKEAAVATLVDQAAAIFTAEQALETAVDVAAYGNKFDLVNDDDTEIL